MGNTYLEGTYSEIYPNISQDEAGLKKLFTQFSFPGGISSHVAPTTPGIDPRGRRAGLLAQPRLRSRVRQPGPDRRVRHRRRRGGDGPAGDRVAVQQAAQSGRPTARCCRSCTSTATRSATRRSWPASSTRSWSSSSAAAAGRPISSRGTSRRRCTSSWRPRSTGPSRTSGGSKTTRATKGDTTRPALADDRPAVAQGLDGAEGRRRPADRGHVPRAPGAAPGGRRASRACRAARELDEELPGRRSSSTRAGGSSPELAELAPKGDRRMGANPHANGGMLLRDLRMPDFREPRGRRALARRRRRRRTRSCSGRFLRDVAELNQDQRNFRVFGPDETLSNLLGAVFEVTNRQWDARTTGDDEFLAPDGPRAGLDAERAPVRGLARGLPADRAARRVQQLRGLHPHRRLDVQPARQVAEGDVGAALAPEDRVAELPAGLARLAAGSQRLHPPGPGLPRPRHQQEGRHRPRLPAARRQLPAVGLRSLPAQPALRQRRRRRQARPAAVADDGRGRRALHGGHRHLAVGQQRPGRRAGRRDGLLRRHADARDPGGGLHPARAPARAEDPRRSTSST